MVNFSVIKIGPTAEEEEDKDVGKQDTHTGPSILMKTDAFTVLPPLSPQIPGPPSTPNPYRLVPPISSGHKPSFVILQETGSRPVSRDPSPSGRVSPFRGYGFKPPPSRDISPSRDDEKSVHNSRTRVPEGSNLNRRFSKSVSPGGIRKSGIPRPLNRRISYSPHRTNQILTDVEKRTSSKNCREGNDNLKTNMKSAVLNKTEVHIKNPIKSSNNRNIRKPDRLLRSSENLLVIKGNSNIDLSLVKPDLAKSELFSVSQKPPLPRKQKIKESCKSGETIGQKKSPLKSNYKLKDDCGEKLSTELQKLSASSKRKTNGIKSPIKTPIPAKVTEKSKVSNISTKKNSDQKKSVLVPKSPAAIRISRNSSKNSNVKENIGNNNIGNLSPKLSPRLKNRKISELKHSNNIVKGKSKETVAQPDKSPSENKEPVKNNVNIAEKNNFLKQNILSPSSLITAMKKAGIKKVGSLDSGEKLEEIVEKMDEMSEGDIKESMGKKLVKRGAEDKINSDQNVEEKRDLHHTDTTMSLPLMIGSPKLTQSSTTLIRTTTEPALAPLEPDIIPKFRSALNESKLLMELHESVDTKSQMEEKADFQNIPTSDNEMNVVDKSINSEIRMDDEKVDLRTDIADNVVDLKTDTEDKTQKNDHEVIVNNDPEIIKPANSDVKRKRLEIRPEHIMAITKIESRKQNRGVISTEIAKIKQEPELEVLSANNLMRMENRNGTSNAVFKTDKSSTEILQHEAERSEDPSVQKSKFWDRLNCKCLKSHCCEKYCGKNTSIGEFFTKCKFQCVSCYQKVSCCPGYNCKFKKPVTTDDDGDNAKSKIRNCLSIRKCGKCFSCCKWNKILRKEKESKSVKKENEPIGNFCSLCKQRFMKCITTICCFNQLNCRRLKCCNKVPNDESNDDKDDSGLSNSATTRKRKRRHWTRIFTDLPKLDPSFVEHGSVMRASIPVLAVPLAWICLVMNVFLPGSGTFFSGVLCLFVGQPRYSVNDSILARFGAFLINILVGASQLFTVLFCLVGWGWSIWWGVLLLRMARKNRRIKLAEIIKAPRDPVTLDQNHDVERGIPMR